MTQDIPLIYIKAGCPWCAEALAFMDQHKLSYKTVNVSADPAAFTEMIKVSGQSKAPTMVWKGDVLADFGAAELEPFLKARKVI